MLDLEFLELIQSFLSEELLAQFGEGLLLKKKMGLLGILLSGLVGLACIQVAYKQLKKIGTPIHFTQKANSFQFTTNFQPPQTIYVAGLSSP